MSTSPSPSLVKKANAYLVDGRVAALRITADRADFAVAGSAAEPYKVAFLGDWICNCPAQVAVCAHIYACQKITRIEPARQILFTDPSDELTAFLNG